MDLNIIQNVGQVDQSDEVLQVLNDICMSEEHADVSFIIESTKIPAHKTILSARSLYFQTLFRGSFAEAKQNEIELKVPLNAFKSILKYIYTGCLSLGALETNEIMEVYDLANQYGFDTLKKIVLEYLTVNLTLDNCVLILNLAHLYSLDDLQAACMNFMDCHSNELLEHDTFKDLLLSSLCALLKRDTFYAPEIEIFKAICNWSTNNPNADAKEAFSIVRWLELSNKDLFKIVYPSKVLDRTQISNWIERDNNSDNTTCRIPYSKKGIEENVATIEHGAKVISGENESALLSGNFTDYDWKAGCTFHAINGFTGSKLFHDYERKKRITQIPIIVDLGKVRFINYIKMLLLDGDSRSYSYYIDVSLDGTEYTRLIDHTESYQRSWQNLYFQSRPVRFIKLVGTRAINIIWQRNGYYFTRLNGTSSRYYDSFDIVGLQAMFTTTNYPNLVNAVTKPTKNVAKIEYGAKVINGHYYYMMRIDAMLNENSDEFTCHEKGSHILIQLNQPYYIDSLRMLLGNSMNHSTKYSFCIETSMDYMDGENWKMAVDKRNETLSGWQEFDFMPRSATFIKITGSQSDDNFICTYFECPRNPN